MEATLKTMAMHNTGVLMLTNHKLKLIANTCTKYSLDDYIWGMHTIHNIENAINECKKKYPNDTSWMKYCSIIQVLHLL